MLDRGEVGDARDFICLTGEVGDAGHERLVIRGKFHMLDGKSL